MKRVLRWANRNRDWLLPGFVIVETGIVFLLVLSLISGQHQANLDSCGRGNEARLASVKEKRSDLDTLRHNVRLWEVFQSLLPPEVPPRFALALDSNISSLNRGIQHKREGISEAIESQASVAIKPGSPVIDCAAAFP